jgi:5-methylcytosine-specific restriction endonuclease McrA
MNDSTCIHEGCERPRKSRNWCHSHYEYLRNRGELPAKPCKGCGAPCPGHRHYCSDECRPRCEVSDCMDAVACRGWCTFHYTRWKLTGDPTQMYDRIFYEADQACAFADCNGKARKIGYCSSHYAQVVRGADLAPLKKKSGSKTCAFCGGPSGLVKGFRKYCSANCQQLYYRHGADLPSDWACVLCAEVFPYVVDGRRRVKFDAKMCDPCRRNSSKHGYSAAQLAKRDGTDCKLCGEPVDMTLTHPNLMRGSVDHIIPTSLGGSNEPENVWLAHLHCNIKKNNRVEVLPMT